MGKIAIRAFTGEIPKSPTHLLPDTAAQRAVNCDFTHGDLRPVRNGKFVAPIGFPPRTIYSDDGVKFIAFADDAQVYKSPVIGDTFNRVYYTDSQDLFVSSLNNAPTGIRRNTDIPRFKVGVFQPNSVRFVVEPDTETITNFLAFYNVKVPGNGRTSGQFNVTRGVDNGDFIFRMNLKQVDDPNNFDISFSLVTKFGSFGFKYAPGDTITLTSPKTNFSVSQLVEQIDSTQTRLTVRVIFEVLESAAIAVTQVNTFNEEGAPKVSDIRDIRLTDKITVTIEPTRPLGFSPIQLLRVYKTTPSGTGFALIKEVVPPENGNFTQTLTVNELILLSPSITGGLTSENYQVPPSGLKNLVLMPNGFFAASKGNTLYFSEPYRPHAWVNSISFPHDIVGIALGEQQLVVTTKANPYIVIGVSPDTVTQQRLPDIQAGFNSRSMTNSNGKVVYVSRDGFVTVNGPTSSLAESQSLFTREDWRNRYDVVLGTMQLLSYDGRLLSLNPNNTTGFLLRLDEAAGNYTQLQILASCMTIVPIVDSVYYAFNNDLLEFGTGAYMTAVWHSKEFILPRPSSFAAGFINSTGDVLVELFTDEGLFSSQTVTGKTFFRIRSGQPSRRWSIRLTTQAIVKEFLIAESMRDLQNG